MNKADFWFRHLTAIEREGISTKAYAEREGVSSASLYQWRNKLQQRQGAKAGTCSALGDFVALAWPSTVAVSTPMAYTLRLASGLTLELSALPDAQWLATLNSALTQERR